MKLYQCLLSEQILRHNVLTTYGHEPLLSTVLLKISSPLDTNTIVVRAVLDSGSQFNFIRQNLLTKIHLRMKDTQCRISGIGKNELVVDKCVELKIHSCHYSYNRILNCLVVDKILNSFIPSEQFNIANWKIPNNLRLADPKFNFPNTVDMLLGLDVFWKVLNGRRIELGDGIPSLFDTRFGWVIGGTIDITNTTQNNNYAFTTLRNHDLQASLEKFWSIEDCTHSMPLTQDELKCEEIYSQTTIRDQDGRFVISLPFKDPPSLLGNSRRQALKRFLHLERKLSQDDNLCLEYTRCMSDYISNGYMREINENLDKNVSYYIPHHAVCKEFSTTTKTRIVFDASMKTSSGVSLNDILYKGPVIQHEMLSQLVCVRIPKYVFTADVAKMYFQIRMSQEHTKFQRIFWRESKDHELKVYELLRLTFGLRPAPFLATRSLQELALKYCNNMPLVKEALLNDFYVDDCLTGADSFEDAIVLRDGLIKILETAGFELRKWCSNDPKLLDGIKPEFIEKEYPFSFNDEPLVKTLGMLWSPKDDTFQIRYYNTLTTPAHTKRQILSLIASIFDPMGLIGPVIVVAKRFMQMI